MNDDIDKADRIVGLTIAINHDWGCPTLNSWRDKIRRGAYAEWFAKNTQRDQWPNLNETIASQAERIVRIDAEERRTKEPDDGLPPGPWRYTHGLLRDATDRQLFDPMIDGRTERLVDYVARCGSPAVRRLLAAYDVTDEQVHNGSAAVIRMANESGTVCATRAPWAGAEILCWLTPRSKP